MNEGDSIKQLQKLIPKRDHNFRLKMDMIKAFVRDKDGPRALKALRASGYEPNFSQLCDIPFLPNRRASSRVETPSLRAAIRSLRELQSAYAGTRKLSIKGRQTDIDDDWTFVDSVSLQHLNNGLATKRLRDAPGLKSLKDAPAQDRAIFAALTGKPARGDLSRFSTLIAELEAIDAHRWMITFENPRKKAIAQLVCEINVRTGKSDYGIAKNVEQLLDAVFRAAHEVDTRKKSVGPDVRDLQLSLERERAKRRGRDNKLYK